MAYDGKDMEIMTTGYIHEQYESGRFLPVRADEVTSWITAEDAMNRTAWERRLRAWIRAELAPRQQAQP